MCVPGSEYVDIHLIISVKYVNEGQKRARIYILKIIQTKKNQAEVISVFFSQIFRDFGEIDVDIYLAGCQGEWHSRQNRDKVNVLNADFQH